MKTRLLLFFLLIGSSRLLGQVGIQENIILQNIGNEAYVSMYEIQKPADMDGDGDTDIVVLGYNAVYWFENIDGEGNFDVYHVIVANFESATGLAVGDVDGDGDMDVISSSYDDVLVWFENIDGDGTFGSPNTILSNFRSLEIFLIDMDNDGDNDIVHYKSTVYWMENLDGEGTFSANKHINGSNNYSSIFLEDLDGDGDIDLLTTAWQANELAWYENLNDQDAFSTKQIISSNATNAGLSYVSDIDGDGAMDIITVENDGNTLGWYKKEAGSGIYSSRMLIPSTLPFMASIAVGDIDGDNDLDIHVSSHNSDGHMAWMENEDGLGTFGVEHSIDDVSNGVNDSVLAKIDSDNDLDILIIDHYGYMLGWMENTDALGNFGLQKTINLKFVNPDLIESGDMDSDGDQDIVTVSNIGIIWSENKEGRGVFDNEHIINGDIGYIAVLKVDDIDDDGDNDVLVADNGVSGEIQWYENAYGDGAFFIKHTIAVNSNSGTRSVSLSDIDADGDLDILASFPGENPIKLFVNIDGNGTFGPEIIIESSTINNHSMVVSDDLDGDNDMDVIVISNDAIAWYENVDGMGQFGAAQNIETSLSQESTVFTMDIDGDGDKDIVYSSSDNTIAWYENLNGQGDFGPLNLINTIYNGLISLVPSDIDNDGDIDFIAAYGLGRKIVIIDNNNGLFDYQTYVVDNDALNVKDVAFADIDGDGDSDIIAAYRNPQNYLKLFKNLGRIGNIITGNINYDITNNDCQGNDVYGVGSSMIVATNGVDTFSTFSQSSGAYEIVAGDGEYNIYSADAQRQWFDSNPESHSVIFDNLDGAFNADFCLQPNATINDLTISVYPIRDDPRPGFETSYQIVYKNVGTQTLSGTINYTFDDSRLSLASATQNILSQVNGELSFDYTDLKPLETRTIDLVFNVFLPPVNQMGDIVVTSAVINPVSGDFSEEDNFSTLSQFIINSYDPNDITVLEGEEITIDEADKYLHYLIRFQNTGTASAINVRVEHVLDDKLDWSTMLIDNLSHVGRVEIVNQTDVSFIFNNIHLPDSTNDEPNSHGFIAFKIKPKSDVEVGDIISGVADIYFDFNPAIVTNTVNTEIAEPLNVDEFNFTEVKLYPNPANNKLVVSSSNMIDKVSVVDLNGRMLSKIEILANSYTLDVSTFSKGVYFLEIQSGNSKVTKKFIKD